MPAELLAAALRGLHLPPGAGLAVVPLAATEQITLPARIRASAPRRRASFTAGRLAARTALRRAGLAEAEAPGMDADGLPVWPAGWRGSISHGGSLAAAIAAPAGTARLIGLDIERLVTPETARRLAPDVMPELPPGRSGLSLHHEVTRVFSAKEALFKALYPATRQFRAFSAAHADWLPEGMALTLAEDWGPDWAAGARFEAIQRVAADHVATILWR
ncbi:4'-phosphopantetheinyl transferase [Paracoccus sp. S1E-3]|uniref:4'-phosphopantetheinyl transferase family protein n=1 Tax=Paracoccus sp. S1E-3 TaxID=2756130 RepID=UPI002101D881|nr:4'-phosphopantetheinyl transferase superfamily protein [Paracoccus sp. S1E-3]